MRSVDGATGLLVAVVAVMAAMGTSNAQPSPSMSPLPSPVGQPSGAPLPSPPPAGAAFDYQIGGDYPPPEGVTVVSRDWFEGAAPDDLYAICYVNAFQTQDDDPAVERPDERSAWPPELVLTELGDDPDWGGEYLVDISTPTKRAAAAAWVEPMVRTCAEKGFEAVEYDNLDSWTRFDGIPRQADVPFGRADAIAYAELLVDLAHANGMAAAQKNTAGLSADIARDLIGFDFAIAEECERWRECQAYRDVYGDHVIVIEYRLGDFARACRNQGDALSVVLRDVMVTQPGSDTYRYLRCPGSGG